jgi:hypothetical protein
MRIPDERHEDVIVSQFRRGLRISLQREPSTNIKSLTRDSVLISLSSQNMAAGQQQQKASRRTGGELIVGGWLPALSLLSACVVVGLTLAWWDGGLPGIDAATRHSARFSALVFAVALGTRRGSSGVAWMHAFVAAHLVHYATVSYEAMTNVQHRLHSVEAWDLVVIGSGALLLVPLVAFPGFQRGALWRRLNGIAVFLVAATFAGGAALNATHHRAALIPVIPLAVGLTIHVYRGTARFQRT